jgi:hypothetical protein
MERVEYEDEDADGRFIDFIRRGDKPRLFFPPFSADVFYFHPGKII